MQRRRRIQELLGSRQLAGKSFYLDAVNSRSSLLLVEAIARLGGKVESFLNKDVSFVVSGSQEAQLVCRSGQAERGLDTCEDGMASSPGSALQRGTQSSCHTATRRAIACGSRGKALLEKAIRNKELCQRSSVLANAQSWGVKILHVDDFLSYINRLTMESSRAKSKELEKTSADSSLSRIVKAGELKSPYLKVEDSSRKCRPLHVQSMTFPVLEWAGRFSPFEPPAPPPFSEGKDQAKSKVKERRWDLGTNLEKLPHSLPLTPSRPYRKKTLGYCECCLLAFKELEEHLQSDQHRKFVRDASHYSVVDTLVAVMQQPFSESPTPLSTLMSDGSSTPKTFSFDPSLELEPQAYTETERAIQALLSEGTLPSLSPAQAMEVCPASVGRGQAPPASLTTSAAATNPVRQPLALEGVSRPGVSGEEPGWMPGKLSVESCRHPEGVGIRSCTLDASPFSSFQNPRKSGRSYSLSPHASKKRRNDSGSVALPVMQECGLYPIPLNLLQDALLTAVSQMERADSSAQAAMTGQDMDGGQGVPNPELRNSPLIHSTTPANNLSSETCSGLMVGVAEQSSPGPILGAKPAVVPSLPRAGFFQLPALTLKYASVKSDASKEMGVNNHPCLDFGPLSHKLCPTNNACCPDESRDSTPLSHSFSSVCIEASLLPDLSACSLSSESDWDCELLSRLIPAGPLPARDGQCFLDLKVLQRSCAEIQGGSYESQLCSVLHPLTPPTSLCGEDTDPVLSSRTIEPCVETYMAV